MTPEQAAEIVAYAAANANEHGHAVLYSDLHRLDQFLVAQAEQLRELREATCDFLADDDVRKPWDDCVCSYCKRYRTLLAALSRSKGSE